jgi:hypothetical protein
LLSYAQVAPVPHDPAGSGAQWAEQTLMPLGITELPSLAPTQEPPEQLALLAQKGMQTLVRPSHHVPLGHVLSPLGQAA